MRGLGGFQAFYYLQTLLTGDNETRRKTRTVSYPRTVIFNRGSDVSINLSFFRFKDQNKRRKNLFVDWTQY